MTIYAYQVLYVFALYDFFLSWTWMSRQEYDKSGPWLGIYIFICACLEMILDAYQLLYTFLPPIISPPMLYMHICVYVEIILYAYPVLFASLLPIVVTIISLYQCISFFFSFFEFYIKKNIQHNYENINLTITDLLRLYYL